MWHSAAASAALDSGSLTPQLMRLPAAVDRGRRDDAFADNLILLSNFLLQGPEAEAE